VAYPCNPSLSGGRDQEDLGSKPAWVNSSQNTVSKTTLHKKKKKKKRRAGMVSLGAIRPEELSFDNVWSSQWGVLSSRRHNKNRSKGPEFQNQTEPEGQTHNVFPKPHLPNCVRLRGEMT
jgi:hypothetical protein